MLATELAKDRNAKYGMPWLAGPYNTTPALDKSSDPWGSDAAVNTLCRVWGLDPSGVSESIEVTQLQCAIVASTVRRTGVAPNRSAAPPHCLCRHTHRPVVLRHHRRRPCRRRYPCRRAGTRSSTLPSPALLLRAGVGCWTDTRRTLTLIHCPAAQRLDQGRVPLRGEWLRLH